MGFADKLKDAVSSAGGKSESTGGDAAAGGSKTEGGERQKDYGDKAFDFISQKSGHKVNDNTSEKITDGARGLYEKATGSKVDPKYSN